MKKITTGLMSELKDRYTRAIIMVCIISLFLNVMGIGWGISMWGLNELTFPALRMAKNKDLNPHDFIAPSLHKYMIAMALAPYYAYLAVTGELNSISADPRIASVSPSFIINASIISRLVSVVMGSLTVLIVYLIGRDVYNKSIGLISSSFLTVTMGFVNMSHFATVDTPATFWIALSMLFFIRIIKTGQMKYYLLGGITSGFATSTKYTAGLLVLPFLISHVLSKKRSMLIDRNLMLGIIFILTGFIIGTPYSLLDFSTFSSYITYHQSATMSAYKGILNPNCGYVSHILNLMNAMGQPLFLISTMGVPYVAYGLIKRCDKSYKYSLLIFSWIIPLYIIVGSWNCAPMRYIVPIIPFLVLFAGKFVYDVITMSSGMRKKILIAIFSLVLVYSLVYTLVADSLFINDSRYAAEEWMEENMKENSTVEIYSSIYAPQFPDHVIIITPNSSGFGDYRFPVKSKEKVERWERFITTLEERKSDYIVLSSLNYIRYFADPDAYPHRTEFFSGLVHGPSNYETVEIFGRPIDESPDAPGFGSDVSIQTRIIQSITLKPNPDFVNPTILILKRKTGP